MIKILKTKVKNNKNLFVVYTTLFFKFSKRQIKKLLKYFFTFFSKKKKDIHSNSNKCIIFFYKYN